MARRRVAVGWKPRFPSELPDAAGENACRRSRNFPQKNKVILKLPVASKAAKGTLNRRRSLVGSVQRNSKNLNLTASYPSADSLTLFVFASPNRRVQPAGPTLRCGTGAERFHSERSRLIKPCSIPGLHLRRFVRIGLAHWRIRILRRVRRLFDRCRRGFWRFANAKKIRRESFHLFHEDHHSAEMRKE